MSIRTMEVLAATSRAAALADEGRPRDAARDGAPGGQVVGQLDLHDGLAVLAGHDVRLPRRHVREALPRLEREAGIEAEGVRRRAFRVRLHERQQPPLRAPGAGPRRGPRHLLLPPAAAAGALQARGVPHDRRTRRRRRRPGRSRPLFDGPSNGASERPSSSAISSYCLVRVLHAHRRPRRRRRGGLHGRGALEFVEQTLGPARSFLRAYGALAQSRQEGPGLERLGVGLGGAQRQHGRRAHVAARERLLGFLQRSCRHGLPQVAAARRLVGQEVLVRLARRAVGLEAQRTRGLYRVLSPPVVEERADRRRPVARDRVERLVDEARAPPLPATGFPRASFVRTLTSTSRRGRPSPGARPRPAGGGERRPRSPPRAGGRRRGSRSRRTRSARAPPRRGSASSVLPPATSTKRCASTASPS